MTSLSRGTASPARSPELFSNLSCFRALWRPLALSAAIVLTQPLFAGRAHASTYSILHKFSDGTVANDGRHPKTSLIQGTDGNFYGIANSGGVGAKSSEVSATP